MLYFVLVGTGKLHKIDPVNALFTAGWEKFLDALPDMISARQTKNPGVNGFNGAWCGRHQGLTVLQRVLKAGVENQHQCRLLRNWQQVYFDLTDDGQRTL